MSAVRRRKLAAKADVRASGKEVLSPVDHEQVYSHRRIIWAIWNIVGCIVMVYCGYRYAVYCGALNETHLWFSNIKVSIKEIKYNAMQ